jgi:DNA repair protein RAD57
LIARSYLEQTGKSLPITAMVFDGSPGRVSFKDTVAAFANILPGNLFIRFLGVFTIRVIYGLYMFTYMVMRKRNLIDVLRRDLNDQRVFGKETPRLYLYSEKDEVVRERDVVDHADEAEAVGYRVYKGNFGKGDHCALLLEDEDRYWRSITTLWGSV